MRTDAVLAAVGFVVAVAALLFLIATWGLSAVFLFPVLTFFGYFVLAYVGLKHDHHNRG